MNFIHFCLCIQAYCELSYIMHISIGQKTIKDWSQFLFGSWRNNLNQVVHTVYPALRKDV
jgi:hypothetical protein